MALVSKTLASKGASMAVASTEMARKVVLALLCLEDKSQRCCAYTALLVR